MLKKLMIGTALSALALSGAFAQSNPSTDPPANSQQSQSTSSGGSSMNSSTMDKSPSAASSTSSSPSSATTGQASSPSSSASSTATSGAKFVSSQQTNQWLSSKFIGIDVVGTDDKKIGDVSDVLFDQQGKVEAYVIGVGGFLGIGAKDVALAPSAFQPVKDNNNNERLKLSMTKEELEKAPAFERKQEPRPTTTGAASPTSGSPRPAGAPAGTAR
jgi:sporulation protein YlmC with PRC-barrel domain